MQKEKINRRDFIKLLSLIPLSLAITPLKNNFQQETKPKSNIIVIVYDAWAARNTSLYGYPKSTMPNLESFANKSIVYHQHYSAGNWTVPGTASLLTGVYPWKHKALAMGGLISPEYQEKQLFNQFAPDYSTTGYTQNKNANIFLYQSGRGLKNHISSNEFNLNRKLVYNLPAELHHVKSYFAN